MTHYLRTIHPFSDEWFAQFFFSNSLSMIRMEMQNFAICPISLDSNYIDNFLIKKRIKMVSFYFVLIQCIFAMHIWRTNQIFLIFGTTKVFSQDCVNTLWVVQSKYCYILNTPENWTRLFIIIPSLCMTNLCL